MFNGIDRWSKHAAQYLLSTGAFNKSGVIDL
jgi:hypothetical protein